MGESATRILIVPQRHFHAAGGLPLEMVTQFFIICVIITLVLLAFTLLLIWRAPETASNVVTKISAQGKRVQAIDADSGHRRPERSSQEGMVRCPKCGELNHIPPIPIGEKRAEFTCTNCNAKLLYRKSTHLF